MVPTKSFEEVNLFVTLLHDIHLSHGVVFNHRAFRLTAQKAVKRYASEGIGFLTKTLPRLGKCLDKALTSSIQLTAAHHRFKTMNNSELPIFMGEFFSRIFDPNGVIRQDPCAESILILRQLLYSFYKYKLNYEDKQKQAVVDSFQKIESDLSTVSYDLRDLSRRLYDYTTCRRQPRYFYRKRLVQYRSDLGSHKWDPLIGRSEDRYIFNYRPYPVTSNGDKCDRRLSSVRDARLLLWELFRHFDPTNILPRHGPGAVSTKEKLWDKYRFRNVPDRIADLYPIDAYFYASVGHVCDRQQELSTLASNENSARVVLVPKDSRGPRLISCEPLEFQYVQQGLSKAIVGLVEKHELTKFNVFFTDQGPNQRGSLLGSSTGRYATLDLNEASDRVSLELVRLLFPEPLLRYLEGCRSLSTELPDGKKLILQKHAPMGSALCFPIMALTIWSLLTAIAPDADTRESILVYGDDVIVPTAFAANAIEQLESFGLKINRDKSCISGFFRESCGVDAFKGHNVTPVRFRTVWSPTPSPDSYVSWIAYANSLYHRKYFSAYDYIVSHLCRLYGEIPEAESGIAAPSLIEVPPEHRPRRRRRNHHLQKMMIKVLDCVPTRIRKVIDGWRMLLRYFTEGRNVNLDSLPRDYCSVLGNGVTIVSPPLDVSTYTKRRSSMLVWRWR